METLRLLLHDFLVLFAMVNAVGNLPIFAEMTRGMEWRARARTFLLAIATGGGIVLCFALFGDVMLRNVFAVSTSAFRIAGGILVFIVAARGVILGSGQAMPVKGLSGSFAVFPLGFPYLAGPGTILTSILLMQTNGNLLTAVTVVVVYAAIFPVLLMAPLVERIIGKLGVAVIARILYIFICAKAVSFVLSGLNYPV